MIRKGKRTARGWKQDCARVTDGAKNLGSLRSQEDGPSKKTVNGLAKKVGNGEEMPNESCEASRMRDFTIRVTGEMVLFRFGVDFAEGEERLCWTLPGIEKLIAHGLWKREFDRRGNVLKKPISVEVLMQKSGAAPK